MIDLTTLRANLSPHNTQMIPYFLNKASPDFEFT